MKLNSLLTAIMLGSALIGVAQTPSTTPQLDYVMQLRVYCDSAVVAGASSTGTRLTIPIAGGSFSGPNIKGTVLKGGADFQLIHEAAGRTDLEALYNIMTDDGVTIHVRNKGIIKNNGGEFYFYTVPAFEAPVDSPYAWLNDAIFVCRPDDNWMPGGVVLNVWRVCDPTR